MKSSKSLKYRRFNWAFIAIVFCCSLLVVGLNIIIDPYGVMGSPAIASLNKLKPEKVNHTRLFKAVDIIRIKPKTIFLGTSTTDYGLDPNHPALEATQPAYNIGLPSVNVYEMMRYFEHTLYNQPDVKQVIIGVDLFPLDKTRPNKVDFDEKRLETKALTIQDIWNATFSMNAFSSSLTTIATNLKSKNFEPYAVNGTRNENWQTSGKPPIYTFITSLDRDMQEQITISDERFNNLKRIIEICRERNIDIKIFTPPLHAAVAAGYYVNGKIEVLEQMKRRLAEITPFWDFFGFNTITTESISSDMKNYIDPFHYRKSVGNLVLNRILNFQETTVPSDFGVLITPENINNHFAQTKSKWTQWQKSHTDFVQLLQSLERIKGL